MTGEATVRAKLMLKRTGRIEGSKKKAKN